MQSVVSTHIRPVYGAKANMNTSKRDYDGQSKTLEAHGG